MLNLNVGCARKVGEANYSSRGASVNLELEIESRLVEEPHRLQTRIRDLFQLVEEAVEDQLESSGRAETNSHGRQNGHRQRSNRLATELQCRALRAIAGRQRFDLHELLHERFDVDRPEDLWINQASAMIDHLIGTANTRADRSGLPRSSGENRPCGGGRRIGDSHQSENITFAMESDASRKL